VVGSGVSWTICKSAPCCRQITTPAPSHSVFLQARCPICSQTHSVKAVKTQLKQIALFTLQNDLLLDRRHIFRLTDWRKRWRVVVQCRADDGVLWVVLQVLHRAADECVCGERSARYGEVWTRVPVPAGSQGSTSSRQWPTPSQWVCPSSSAHTHTCLAAGWEP